MSTLTLMLMFPLNALAAILKAAVLIGFVLAIVLFWLVLFYCLVKNNGNKYRNNT